MAWVPDEPPCTLIRRCALHAPDPRGVVDVLLAFDRVLAVGADLAAPSGCTTIDAAGLRAIPGLVDAHVHLIGGGGEDGPASRVPPLRPSSLVAAGVTTVVGVLGTDGTTRALIDLLATVRGLEALGLSARMWTGSYEVPPPTLTGSVRRDLLLVPEVIGVGEVAISDHRASGRAADAVVRLAADCHVGGLLSGKRARLHLHVGDGRDGLGAIRRALEASDLPPEVFFPTHVNRSARLWSEARELAARGVVCDVTASEAPACAEPEDGPSAATAVATWIDEGLPPGGLTVSSDAGGSLPRFDARGRIVGFGVGRPSALIDTLRDLLRRDRPLGAVLPFFTTHAADHLGLSGKGRVAPGADADLVLLDEDARVHTVIARGRIAFREGEARLRGRFEA